MTLDQLLRTGEKPSPAMAIYPEEYGGGYMATIEAIHMLHCTVSCNAGKLDLCLLPSRTCFVEPVGATITKPLIMPSTTLPRHTALISVGILIPSYRKSSLCFASDHCIEILRQDIMCRSDATMLTYDWEEGLQNPVPDFNVFHQCKNFKKILDWVDEHRVIVPTSDMVRLNDTIDLLFPP